VKTVQKYCESE